eukprot:2687031-Prorocentrum_lima.AAC.1
MVGDASSSVASGASKRRKTTLPIAVAKSIDVLEESSKAAKRDLRIESIVSKLRESPDLLNKIEAIMEVEYRPVDEFPRGVRTPPIAKIYEKKIGGSSSHKYLWRS